MNKPNSDDERHVQDCEAEAHREAVRVEAALAIAHAGLSKLLWRYGGIVEKDHGSSVTEPFRAETCAWLEVRDYWRTAAALREFTRMDRELDKYDVEDLNSTEAFARLAHVFFTEQVEKSDAGLAEALLPQPWMVAGAL